MICLVPGGGLGKKMLGGCATVAGWGHRYGIDNMDFYESKCMTDFSNLSPDKIQ